MYYPNNTTDYATKGQALGVGIPALVAAGLALFGQGGNLPFVGGNNNAAKDAEIAQLKAEKYSDNAAKEESNRLLQNYLKPYGDAIVSSQVKEAKMEAEIECLKKTQHLEKEILSKEIQLARQEAACCCTQNANAIAQVAATLNQIVTPVVKNKAVCPGWGDVTITPTTTTTAAAA